MLLPGCADRLGLCCGSGTAVGELWSRAGHLSSRVIDASAPKGAPRATIARLLLFLSGRSHECHDPHRLRIESKVEGRRNRAAMGATTAKRGDFPERKSRALSVFLLPGNAVCLGLERHHVVGDVLAPTALGSGALIRGVSTPVAPSESPVATGDSEFRQTVRTKSVGSMPGRRKMTARLPFRRPVARAIAATRGSHPSLHWPS